MDLISKLTKGWDKGIFLAAIGMVGISAGICPVPTDLNVCIGNQEAMCDNGCVKKTAVQLKHKDCRGSGSEKLCNRAWGTGGYTYWVYKQYLVNDKCVSCLDTLIEGPSAGAALCLAATTGSVDPKCQASGS
jgi:hypothetical protein